VNEATKQLIPVIVSYVAQHGGSVTKTRLLKLLYLFDVEYYRTHRETFTGFSWKFFHLGPWAPEYDETLSRLVAHEDLIESESAWADYDTKFYRTPRPHDFDKLFPAVKDWAALKCVLETWGTRSTGEILDYVYFRTDPMEHGVRHETLDFSTIPTERPLAYTRSSSGKTQKEIAALRRKFQQQTADRASVRKAGYTKPRYDEQFFEALSRIDKLTG
jgi:hypothetical protein